MLTPKVMLREGPTPTIPPVSVKQIETAIEPLVSLFVGSASSAEATTNPLLERMLTLEKRLDSLASVMQAGQAAASPAPGVRPMYAHRRAVIVGISISQSRDIPSLVSAEKDARELAKLLDSKYGFTPTLLLNATNVEVLNAVRAMAMTSAEDDFLAFYFSGRGMLSDSGDQLALLASDSTPNHDVLLIKEILSLLVSGKSKYTLAIVDACHAAAGISSFELPSHAERSLLCLTACAPNEISFENNSGGIFTQSLLKVLATATVNSPLLFNEAFGKIFDDTIVKTNGQQRPVLLSFGNGAVGLPPIYPDRSQ